ncbi:DUF5130 family protein [Rhodococcus hoagii]|nr:DUF5130 family protein [Prescottella equi]
MTTSGRLSGVHRIGEPFDDLLPFTTDQLVRLDDALTDATRSTKVRFNVYVGDLGENTALGADAIFPHTPEAERSVLIAVSPNQRAIEVRAAAPSSTGSPTGSLSSASPPRWRRSAEGDLVDGLVSALRVMSAAIAPK